MRPILNVAKSETFCRRIGGRCGYQRRNRHDAAKHEGN